MSVQQLCDGEKGFVDTCDMVSCATSATISPAGATASSNVGGFKVMPEEVEAVINRHPGRGVAPVLVAFAGAIRSPARSSLPTCCCARPTIARRSVRRAQARDSLQHCRIGLAPSTKGAGREFRFVSGARRQQVPASWRRSHVYGIHA